MQYLALASDYDGTLAHDGVVSESTIESLEKLRQSGRKLILVTGRVLSDLQSVFSRIELFDRVVAENGAVVYSPSSHETRVLADAPKSKFVDALKAHGITELGIGEVIVATCRPH